MPAANTDKFLKATRKRAGALDSSGISSAVIDHFGLDSASGLPTDTAVSITIDRVDSNGVKTPAKEEEIIGVVSGDQIVSAVRGVSGTAQSHAAGAVWEIRLTAAQWNRMVDGFVAEHGQDGKHSLATMDGIRYAADAGGDDTYAVTLSPVPAAYYSGMEINFKPTTANTGACTLDVNGLGAKTIKKGVSSDLATGDILAGQLVKVIYDGTNFQLVSAGAVTQIVDTNGNEEIKTVATASAVNEITVTNAATTGTPDISPSGDDTNIHLSLQGKGTGKVLVETPYQSAQLESNFTTTSGSYVDVTGLSIDVVLAKVSNVRVTISGRFQNNTTASFFYIQLLVGAVVLREFSLDIMHSGIGDDRSFVVVDEARSAGTHTYKLQMKTQGGNSCVFIPTSPPELIIESSIA